MKQLFFLVTALAVSLGSWSQQPDGVAAQRARIAAERAQAETTFRDDEKACYRKFAVNDCVNSAKERRRGVIANLRREEIALNDAERKRKAAERLQTLQERSPAAKDGQQEQQREKAFEEQQGRDARAAEKGAKRSALAASGAGREAARRERDERHQAAKTAAQSTRHADAARNLKDREKRLVEAKERKERLEKRLAERKKPAAKPLPDPPQGAATP